jgi:hypothetical protein
MAWQAWSHKGRTCRRHLAGGSRAVSPRHTPKTYCWRKSLGIGIVLAHFRGLRASGVDSKLGARAVVGASGAGGLMAAAGAGSTASWTTWPAWRAGAVALAAAAAASPRAIAGV